MTGLIVETENNPDDPQPLPILSAWLEIGRDRFAFSTAGDGRPVIFLHGLPGDMRTWEPHQHILRHRFRCIAYTQRWFGEHEWRADGPAMGPATHAADLVEFIGSLGLGRVSLVAWSYSVDVAIRAMLDHPHLFERALLYEPGVASYVEDASEQVAFKEDATAFFEPVLGALGNGDLPAAVAALIDGSGEPGHFTAQPGNLRHIHLASTAALGRLLAAAPSGESVAAADLRGLTVPVTICWGDRTRPLFKLSSRAAARSVSGLHRELPERGHLWPEEDPQGFCALVAEALA